MAEENKQEKFLKYKIKSTIIKNGWYMIYSLLIPLFFALLLQIPWILFAMLIVVYPLWLMVTDIKRLKKELREIKEENTAENNAEASAEKKAGTEE